MQACSLETWYQIMKQFNIENKPERKWWKEAIVYQIYLKSFFDSNGDGIGDIPGIIAKLPYLNELGVNILWICPFYLSPMKDNGYDIADYYQVSPEFGTIGDMDELIRKADAYGIKIMIDMVLNHTSNQHEWFQKALKDKKSPYRSYYIFKNENEINNFRSVFGGSSWDAVGDGTYYFHTFSAEQPDLNWEKEDLRKELYNIMNWWLDKGVCGFRMDAITYIKKNLPTGIVTPDQLDGLAEPGKWILNQEGIGTFLKELKDNTYGLRDAVTVAETPGVPEEDLAEYIGEDGYFSMIFDFSYTDIDLVPQQPWYKFSSWTMKEFKEKLFRNQILSQETGWPALYLENHDQPRSINKYFYQDDIEVHHKEMAKALGCLYFFLRGTPYIYQGEEIGMVNHTFHEIGELDDINSKDQYYCCKQAGTSEADAMKVINRRSRDQTRTPVSWSEDTYGGFGQFKPWLPVNDHYKTINVAKEEQERDSVLNFYKNMVKLHKDLDWKEILIYGYIEEIKTQDMVVVYKRYDDSKEIFVLINMSGENQKVSIPKGTLLLNSMGKINLTDTTFLEPYEAMVIGRNSLDIKNN
jgi:alpha-glucosidase